ncbi:MAG: SDR family NAD(P)-dependent oxidoreductase [Verrucomicrobia bacterium]|nr:SDR family NAD(P)-dependent oxidoreductase [Verrucomicrobiota bacterium]
MSRTVVVTGSSSGFGRKVSEEFARRGERVYASMRDTEGKNAAAAEALEALALKERVDLRVLELDVTSTSSVASAAAKVLAESGAPDVIINNAGQLFVGFTEAFSAEEFTNQLEVNLVGVHRVIRAFLPAMRTRGCGLIVNISSIAGRCTLPFHGVYHASKWALEGYSQSLRTELACSGIDLVVVEPGMFATALFAGSRTPEDCEDRVSTYPAVARQCFEETGAKFKALLADPNAPTDPMLVANQIIALAQAAPGTRPFRSVVGIDFGVGALNAATEPYDKALLESMGLTSFTTIPAQNESEET